MSSVSLCPAGGVVPSLVRHMRREALLLCMKSVHLAQYLLCLLPTELQQA